MGVTGPSRCPGCDEPLDAADKFCGRCGAALLAPAAPSAYGAPPAYGAPAVPPMPPAPPVPPVPPVPPAPAGPADPPPPDPQTRLSYGGYGGHGEVGAPPVPGHAPSVPGPAAPAGPAAVADTPPPVEPPVDPRVAGYEAVADAGAESGAAAAAEGTPAVAGDASTTAEDASTTAGGEPAVPAPGSNLCTACRTGTVGPEGYCEHCGHTRPRERDHMERALAGIAAVSDRGHRHHRNEDFFALRAAALPDGTPAVVAVVCDGVSSATRPDEASQAASEAAGEALLASLPRGTHPQQAMHEAILAASTAVDALAADPSLVHDEQRQQNAPACTFVGAVVGGGLLTVGWVGDSRAYWIPDDRTAPPARLTEDDSWAAQMVANNLMSEAEANADERAHAITGWLGADAYEVEPHTATFKPDGPGVVVVCTDGLWNYAESAEQMAAVLPYDAPTRPLNGARTLVTHALDGGGHDNVTVALVPFPAPSGREGSA
ncbi:PP2C family serine/threonine-protein phosphatase [Streptomyces inhibens]|uniref:PP2C family serine/threonine-protein phosphatase n=1 Tax=Streptomyces inhibens TaxID=2293571 RepID=UPI001EE777FD|nr:PP2C family serine/threonine-protein phosphatase [Streptomyces inhibens]UKY50294.1 protein phosphatase 2C domain-containing protein [Streptomyces inhibens]